MFWAYVTYHGIGNLQPIEGATRSPHDIEVLRRKVVPELEKTYPDVFGVFQ